MLKKVTMLAIAVAALSALAIPTTASAQWQKHGAKIQANEQATVTGQAKFQGQVGFVECQFVSTVQFLANQTTANATFDVDNGGQANDEEKCSVGAGLITVGCTDVEQVTVAGLPYVGHASKALGDKTINVTTGTIQNHLTGGALCPKTIQLTPSTAEVGNFVHLTAAENPFKTGQLSGLLRLHIPGQASQNVQVLGSGSITPSGTFGLVV